MSKITELMKKLIEINYNLTLMLGYSKFSVNGDLSAVDYDSNSADDLFMISELESIMEEIERVSLRIRYLELPIKAKGLLTLNDNGRYEIDGREMTCGSPLEYYDKDFGSWCSSRVEHNGNNYYIVGYDVPIDNVYVRLRY